MADEQVRIVVKVEGDTTGAGKVKTAMAGLGSTAASIATGGLALAAGAIAGVGVAAVAAGRELFNMSSDIDQASNMLAASLGIPKEAAEEFEGVMKGVFANNFGESFEDIGQSVNEVVTQLGRLPDAELQAVTEGALALRDAFDLDVNESIQAVDALMENFGLTSTEAMDFVAAGMQKGLNASGDLVDSITEYSTQFASGGADAEQFFSLLDSGLQQGMLGTDKAADLFKEFRLKITDGSEDVAAALEEVGISGDEFVQSIVSGNVDVADAWTMVQDALKETSKTQDVTALGARIMGTQFEDMGTDAALAIDLTTSKLSDMSGATDALNQQYANFGSLFEGVKRQALTALEPIGGALLKVAQDIMPQVTAFIDEKIIPALALFAEWLGEKIPAAFAIVQSVAGNFMSGLGELLAVFTGVGAEMFDTLDAVREIGFAFGLTSEQVDQMEAVIRSVGDGFRAFFDVVSPIVAQIVDFVTEFVSWKDILIVVGGVIAATVIPALVSLAATIAPVVLAVAAVIAIVATLRNAWESDWAGIRTTFTAAWGVIEPVLAEIGSLFGEIFTEIGAIFKDLGAAFGDGKGPAIDWGKVIKGVASFVIKIVRGLAAVLKKALEGIRKFWDKHGKAIVKIVKAFVKIVKKQIDTVMKVIHGIITVFLKLIKGDWKGAWQTIQKTAAEVWENIKTILRQFIKIFTAAWEAWLKNILKAFLEWVRDTIAALDRWAKDLISIVTKGLADAAKVVIKWVADTAASFTKWATDIITTITKWATDLPAKITKGLADAAKVIVKWVADTAASFTKWAADVIATITKWATDLPAKITKGLADAAKVIVKWVADTAASFTKWATDIITTITKWATDLPAKITKGLADAAKEITTFVTTSLAQFSSWVTSIGTTITSGFAGVVTALKTALGTLVSAVTDPTTWAKLVGIGTKIIEAIVAAWTDSTKLADDLGVKIGEWVGNLVSGWATKAATAIAKLKSIGSQLVTNIIEGFPEIGTLPTKLGAKIGEWVANLVENWATKAATAIKKLLEIGGNIVQGIKDGIEDAFEKWVKGTPFSEIFQGLINAIKNALGIGSPSKPMIEAGKNIVGGLAKGITDNIGLAQAAMVNLADSLIAPTVPAIGGGMILPGMASPAMAGIGAAGAGAGAVPNISNSSAVHIGEVHIHDDMDAESFTARVAGALETLNFRAGR